MEDELKNLLPEILWIRDEKLRESVADTYSDALRTGGWNIHDMKEIPFTLLIPNCSVSYVSHVRAVTRMCHSAWAEWGAIYQGADAVPLEYDILIAGALLHDVGKLVEYSKGNDGKYVKSALGRDLRHPFAGTVIAMRNGISSKIAHIIATHASEGDGTLRTPEAVILNKIDMMNFEVLKSHRGLI